MNFFNFLNLVIKTLNYFSVMLILFVTIYRGMWMKQDVLSPSNIESKFILFAFCLAASTGVMRFMFDRFSETPPFQIVIMAVTAGTIIFGIFVFISLAYLNLR